MNSLFRKAFIRTMTISGLALAAVPIQALGQQDDYFLQIAGVPGESTDAQHTNWIDVKTTSLGVIAAQAPTFSFVTTRPSTASPPLLFAVPAGQHFSTATLAVRHAGIGGNVDYLKYTMTDVTVVSHTFTGPVGLPSEQYQLSFSTLQIEYRMQRPDGTYGPPIITCWDFVGGTSCS